MSKESESLCVAKTTAIFLQALGGFAEREIETLSYFQQIVPDYKKQLRSALELMNVVDANILQQMFEQHSRDMAELAKAIEDALPEQ